MNCQSRNLQNCHLTGVDLPTLGLPNMNSQSRAGICEIAFDEGGRSTKTWSAKCWAVRVGMKYEFHRNLWNCHLMGVDLPRPVCQMISSQSSELSEQESAKLPLDGGRSVRTWSAKWLALRVGMKYELSEQESVKLPFSGENYRWMLGDLQVKHEIP